jgi:hypothetical protein
MLLEIQLPLAAILMLVKIFGSGFEGKKTWSWDFSLTERQDNSRITGVVKDLSFWISARLAYNEFRASSFVTANAPFFSITIK